jgi:ketosteroid isomerase-like protein
MRRGILVCFSVLTLGLTVAVRPAGAQSRDERDVRAVLDRVFQTFNSVDEKVAKQVFAEFSATASPIYPPFLPSVGSTAELERHLSEVLAQASARKFQTTSGPNIRVERNLAWAAFTWRSEISMKDGSQASYDGRTTVAFRKEGRNWRITHVHSSLPARMPPSASALKLEGQAVIQVERAAWEALKSKDLNALSDYFSENASRFSQGQAYRTSGRADLLRELENWISQGELRSYQMLDPQVEVVGDTAVLTYYFTVAEVRGGKDYKRAGKVSLVFVKQGGKWRVLHEHVSTN